MRAMIPILAGAVAFATPAPAQGLGDQISQLFKGADAGCDPNIASQLTEAIRTGIESEVQRAEAALQVPSPISEMGCLDTLFDINLNTLVPVPNLQGMLQSAVSEGQEQLCGFAREKIAEATEPLTAALTLPSFENLGIPGFESEPVSLEFEGLSVGFGSQGQVILDPSIDLNEGTRLREIYDELYEADQ